MSEIEPQEYELKNGEKFTVRTALVQSLIGWTKENPAIEKVTLEVFATNEVAIGLYKKSGFLEEGRRLRHVKIADEKYVDVILMSRFVND